MCAPIGRAPTQQATCERRRVLRDADARGIDRFGKDGRTSMDFGYAPEQEALRQEVLAFIAEHLTPEVVSEMEGLSEGFGVSRSVARGPLVSELFKKIGERGWLGISYPKEYGGQDGDRMSQYIVEEEFARVNIAVGLAGSGAPAILAAGTEEQKRHFIPRLIRGSFRSPWASRNLRPAPTSPRSSAGRRAMVTST
jgi:Acyl-CoA dehydrogenase, N-terminal domain